MKVIRQTYNKGTEIFIVEGNDVEIQRFFFEQYPNREINILQNPLNRILFEVIIKEK